jgi:hypothetical protein
MAANDASLPYNGLKVNCSSIRTALNATTHLATQQWIAIPIEGNAAIVMKIAQGV